MRTRRLNNYFKSPCSFLSGLFPESLVFIKKTIENIVKNSNFE